MDTIAIVGVGLIGGSFALAMRQAGFAGRIVGVSSPAAVAAAVDRGAIDEGMPLEAAAAQADLVYLAQPIDRILETLGRIAPREGALVTDAGSTKRRIVEAGSRLPLFLGGHPMAGKESRGVESADGDLFRGFPYVLTPAGPRAIEHPRAAEFVRWLERIGARVQVMTAEEHDRLVAFTSHLPQLLSTTLALSLQEVDGAERTAGPALRDLTRLASSPFEIWADIFATNPEAIRQAIRVFREQLDRAEAHLDRQEMASLFDAAARSAARWRR